VLPRGHRLVRSHQANKRIIDASAHKLHIAPQKVVLTVDLHGNTSAASIPLALSVAVKDGRVKKAIWCCWKRWAAASPGFRAAALVTLSQIPDKLALLFHAPA